MTTTPTDNIAHPHDGRGTQCSNARAQAAEDDTLRRSNSATASSTSPLIVDSSSTPNARYRRAFMDFAEGTRFTHWLTLNTHRDCSIATAAQRLKRWRVEVMRRVHGYRFHKKADDELFWYLGCPELSLAGHPHFHLAVVVPEPVTPKFEVMAPRRWLELMPSGTCDLQVIGPAEADQRRVLGYAAKWLDPNADLPFVDSRIYR